MTIDKQALREEFRNMQDHYSDPADRERQEIYIAAEALLDENIQLQRGKDAIEAVALALRDDMRDVREKLESAERRIAELESKLSKPVLLPKTNGYWNEQEKAYEEAITLAKQRIRIAGFRCEGDE